jgi:Tol biopolymer transport system component
MHRRRIFSRRNPARSSRKTALPIGLIFVVLAIALCVLVPSNPINLSNEEEPDRTLPTALPTFTPLPQPTKEHIGRLIFTCTRGEFNQLCMINADGTGYQQLTELEAHSYYPVYSPLGGSVVYASNQNGGVFDLFLFTFEGSRLIRLTENIGNVLSPTFSPDGSRILFANRAAEGPTSLWTIDTTGENADLLYAAPNTIVAADWSPTGERIAFAMRSEERRVVKDVPRHSTQKE